MEIQSKEDEEKLELSTKAAIARNSADQNTSNNNLLLLKPCRFFALGVCRNGSACKFSHESLDPNIRRTSASSPSNASTHSSESTILPFTPPTLIVNIPIGFPVFSIDVECGATSTQHNGRAVIQVALVDEWLRPIFNILIKQNMPILSYFTPLTGITKEMVGAHGVPLADALALLRAQLPPNAILVGQNILKDIQWLQLAQGVDYHSLIDIAPLFQVWDPIRGAYTGFSQDHVAKVWLGVGSRMNHNALADAALSMSLFCKYRYVQYDPLALDALQKATLSAPRDPSFSSLNPEIDGCCMGNRKMCKCGAPFLS